MKARYVMGIDIETGGPIVGKHPLLALGLCVYKFDNNNLHYLDGLEIHMDAPLSKYDAETLEFWNNNEEAWNKISCFYKEKEEAAYLTIEFIKKWQKKSLENNLPFFIVTDNCWFDDTWLSSFLCSYGGNPLRHNYYTGFTDSKFMIDIEQMKNGIKLLGIEIPKNKTSVPHDHTPLSDSRVIVENYYYLLKYTEEYKNNIKNILKI
jgi:hypothetical protein